MEHQKLGTYHSIVKLFVLGADLKAEIAVVEQLGEVEGMLGQAEPLFVVSSATVQRTH